jgi:hypothetical protein
MADAVTAPARKRRGRGSGGGSARYRLDVAGRALAAIAGGFLLASALAWLFAAAMMAAGAQPRPHAVHTGTLTSWLVWTGGAMWAFYARGQAGAWGWLVIPAAAAAGLAFLITHWS